MMFLGAVLLEAIVSRFVSDYGGSIVFDGGDFNFFFSDFSFKWSAKSSLILCSDSHCPTADKCW